MTAVDPRVTLWARVTTRVPGACRKFKRHDRRARAGVFRISAGLAAAMLESSVWGNPGGRDAINKAMCLAARLPRRRKHEHPEVAWFIPFGVAFNDGGRVAQRLTADPRKMLDAAMRDTVTRCARPAVAARLRRILPASMRCVARREGFPWTVRHLGADVVASVFHRAVAEGMGAGAMEILLSRLGREKAVRSRFGNHELTGAEVDHLIAREWPAGGAP